LIREAGKTHRFCRDLAEEAAVKDLQGSGKAMILQLAEKIAI
jgi:hypothetical protein